MTARDRSDRDHRVLTDERRGAAALAADLEAELAAIAESTAAGPDDEHDAEGSTVGYERARVSGLLARARLQVEALERAQHRVDDGSYGECVGCAGEIGAERLEALPAVVLCVTCAASTAYGRLGGVG